MKKLAIIGVLVVTLTTSCSSLKIVDQNAAMNAGAAAVQALTISDAQISQLCSQYMVETDGQNASQQNADDRKDDHGRFVAPKDSNAPNAHSDEGEFNKQCDETVHRETFEFKFFCFHSDIILILF